MSDDKSLDIVGIGRLAKSIPAAAWKRVVETACSTFEKSLSPLVETTSGIGRLIQAKFDRLIDAEKVLVANTAHRAYEKAHGSGERINLGFNHLVITKVIEHAEFQADATLSELWSNLLAREMTEGSVHPELADVLMRLTKKDAILLVAIADKEKEKGTILLMVVSALSASILPFDSHLQPLRVARPTVEHVMLSRLGLIKKVESFWRITAFGVELLKAISPLGTKPPESKQN